MAIISNKRLQEEQSPFPAKRHAPSPQDGAIRSLADEIFEQSLSRPLEFNEQSDPFVDACSPTYIDKVFEDRDVASLIRADLMNWVQRGLGSPKIAEMILTSWIQKDTTLTLEKNSDRNAIQGKYWHTIPSCIRFFTHLETLKIYNFKAQSIPNEICFLKNLKDLTIILDKMTVLPDFIYDLRSLIRLSIEAPISCLSEKISQLQQLEYLWIESRFRFKNLPNSFRELRRLQEIEFINTELGFPTVLAELSGLKKLRFINSNVVKFPENLEKMSALKHLYIASCFDHLDGSPREGDTFDFTGINKLYNLEEFTKEDPGRVVFHPELFQLTKLRTLALNGGDGHLGTPLPAAIGNLTALERLVLTSANITSIPDNIDSLTKLSRLILIDNYIQEFPLSLANLSSQCIISAEDNDLSAAALIRIQTEIQRVHSIDPERGPTLEASIAGDEDAEFENEDAMISQDLQDLLNKHLASNLNDEQKGLLTSLFRNIQYTADYQSRTYRPKLLDRLNRMMTDGLQIEPFRNNLFPIIEVATTSCSDRTAIYLNLIEVQWILYCSGKTHTDGELANILIGLRRMELLDEIAKITIEELRLCDPIEAYLYYQIELKESLNLPFSTMGLNHGIIVAGSITPALIQTAQDKILGLTSTADQKTSILCEYDLWKDRIKEESNVEREQILEEFGEKGEAIDDSPFSDQVKLEKWAELQKEQDIRQKNVLIEITKRRLAANL